MISVIGYLIFDLLTFIKIVSNNSLFFYFIFYSLKKIMKKCFARLIAINLFHLTDKLVGNVFAQSIYNENPDDHGFGKLYKWKTVTDGFIEGKKNRKPIMVVIHKAGCPACENLSLKFSNSLKLLDLSKRFVMVNVESSTEQKLPVKFFPDGAYVPRIIFFCPDGKILRDIVNQDPKREPEYKYHYWSIVQIVDSMLRVLNMFPQATNIEYLNEKSYPINICPTSVE